MRIRPRTNNKSLKQSTKAILDTLKGHKRDKQIDMFECIAHILQLKKADIC